MSSSISEGNFYPKAYGNFDFGFQLPIKHTSLWIRNSFGNSFSDNINPFTRFGFASFGNNYIDQGASKMYRGIFSFPGVSYDSDRLLLAKSFYKVMGELKKNYSDTLDFSLAGKVLKELLNKWLD